MIRVQLRDPSKRVTKLYAESLDLWLNWKTPGRAHMI